MRSDSERCEFQQLKCNSNIKTFFARVYNFSIKRLMTKAVLEANLCSIV